MEQDLTLLGNMALALGVALAAGFLANLAKLPVILGYLVAGIVIGPYALGLVEDVDEVETLAAIGVVLLMFTLGVGFSFKTLRSTGRVVILGGIIQIACTTALGIMIGSLLNWPIRESVLFGYLIAQSSSAVIVKVLMDRRELGSPHANIMTGISLVQDLSTVPVIAILPALNDSGMELLSNVGWALLKADAFLVAIIVMGLWGLPYLMKRIVWRGSRELFLLAIVSISLGASFGAYHLGLSMAIGAFLAGLMVSESEYAHEALADVRPLRDIFAALFFVSLGMLADPEFVADNPKTTAMIVISIMVGKFLISAAIPRVFGHGIKTSLLVGSGLVQIGEFSFILAALAFDENVISNNTYAIVLAFAFITILLTPFAMSAASNIYYRTIQRKEIAALLPARETDPEAASEGKRLANHVVICGYGKIARYLGRALEQRGFPYMVVDIDPLAIDAARKKGIPFIFGDASNPEVLAETRLDKARVLVVGFPDPIATKLIVQNARKINRRLDIVARAYGDEETAVLRSYGAAEVVRPDFEVSLEIIRHTLHRYGLSPQEAQFMVSKLREEGLQR
ncbi:MAG: sodium:proton exchanger [Chloroflexi bacterium]|nr:sodium:proton exchanger [Chloroflexota bacterium]